MMGRAAPVSRIIVRDRTPTARVLAMLARGVPKGLAALWRGPVITLRLEDGGGGRGLRWSLRPIDVIVDADHLLKSRFIVPRESKRDLQSAIALFVAHKTPFEAHELLIHSSEDDASATGNAIGYTLHAAPRAAVEAGLKSSGVRPKQVDRLLVDGADGVDFAAALHPKPTWLRWCSLLPVAVALVALGTAGANDLAAKADRVTSMQASVAAALTALRAARSELEARKQSVDGVAEVVQLFDRTASALESLYAARELLPASVGVSRVQIGSDGTRLSIKAPSILDAVRTTGREGLWTATVDGPILADPASGGELGTILLRGQP